jgi:RNA polymerase sigma-70 factor (ECF subfamily)
LEKKIKSLIAKARKKNKRAQMELYSMYADDLFQVAYRILNNRELAEECMQDSFLKAFDKLDLYSDKDIKFFFWLRRITINTSLDAYKKAKKIQEISLDEKTWDVGEYVDDSDWDYFVNENKERFQKAFYRIKDNYRQIISLYYIEGYDLQEISEILNISYSNSKTRMSRAIKAIKNQVKQEVYV